MIKMDVASDVKEQIFVLVARAVVRLIPRERKLPVQPVLAAEIVNFVTERNG